MGTPQVRFYHDHVLVKEGGTRQRTPWHQDQPYYNVDGHGVSAWIPVDPVPAAGCLELMAGSHRGPWLMPRTFLAGEAKWFPDGSLAELPDIEADRDAFDIRRFELEPGDAIFFDFLTVHGAPGFPFGGRRRVLSLRYLSADARHAPRQWRTSPPFDGLESQLPAGAALESSPVPRRLALGFRPAWARPVPGGEICLVVPPSERTCRRLSQDVASRQALPNRKATQVCPMTIRTESRIIIASSVREVWAYVCDVGRWPEWAPTVLECRVRGGGPLQPGSRVEQRAKGPLWLTHDRSQEVTAVEPPRSVAFAGPMATSAARWGMELEPVDDRQTDAKMWIEVDLAGIMRAVPGPLTGRIQRVSDHEMVAIKAAVESGTRGGAES
jgi:Phytanoyl-CoA dioxygenase (PhyH)/Polyketide cyclase / dehydrase and lipid transport